MGHTQRPSGQVPCAPAMLTSGAGRGVGRPVRTGMSGNAFLCAKKKILPFWRPIAPTTLRTRPEDWALQNRIHHFVPMFSARSGTQQSTHLLSVHCPPPLKLQLCGMDLVALYHPLVQGCCVYTQCMVCPTIIHTLPKPLTPLSQPPFRPCLEDKIAS